MNKESKEQDLIFKEAFLVSNFLLLWNIPQRQNLLDNKQMLEVQNRLWNKNTLDALVLERLGDEAWFKPSSERKQLKVKDYQKIKELTEETKQFIRRLEKGTKWEGTMDKELEINRNKSIQQWITENSSY